MQLFKYASLLVTTFLLSISSVSAQDLYRTIDVIPLSENCDWAVAPDSSGLVVAVSAGEFSEYLVEVATEEGNSFAYMSVSDSGYFIEQPSDSNAHLVAPYILQRTHESVFAIGLVDGDSTDINGFNRTSTTTSLSWLDDNEPWFGYWFGDGWVEPDYEVFHFTSDVGGASEDGGSSPINGFGNGDKRTLFGIKVRFVDFPGIGRVPVVWGPVATSTVVDQAIENLQEGIDEIEEILDGETPFAHRDVTSGMPSLIMRPRHPNDPTRRATVRETIIYETQSMTESINTATTGVVAEVAIIKAIGPIVGGIRGIRGIRGGGVAPARTIETILDEGGAKLLRVKTANGKTIEVLTEPILEGDKLILRRTHIGGAEPGEVGIHELYEIARQYGREQGVKQVIIEGGKRSSGKMIGKVPRPIVIDLE